MKPHLQLVTKPIRIIMEYSIREVLSESGEGRQAIAIYFGLPKVVLSHTFTITKRTPHITVHSALDVHWISVQRLVVVGRMRDQTLGARF